MKKIILLLIVSLISIITIVSAIECPPVAVPMCAEGAEYYEVVDEDGCIIKAGCSSCAKEGEDVFDMPEKGPTSCCEGLILKKWFAYCAGGHLPCSL